MTEWISVKDRLPEESERVLVCRGKDAGYPTLDTDRFCGEQWVRWRNSVTHWMPLPEPPEVSEDE